MAVSGGRILRLMWVGEKMKCRAKVMLYANASTQEEYLPSHTL